MEAAEAYSEEYNNADEEDEESFIPCGFFEEEETSIWKTPGLVSEGAEVQNELKFTNTEVK